MTQEDLIAEARRLGESLASDDRRPLLLRLADEVECLRDEALRYYRADGTFEVLGSAEEVVRRRIEAAKRLVTINDLLAACEKFLATWESYAGDDSNGLLDALEFSVLPRIGDAVAKAKQASDS